MLITFLLITYYAASHSVNFLDYFNKRINVSFLTKNSIILIKIENGITKDKN